MAVKPLERVVDELVSAKGDRAMMAHLLYTAVCERAGVMHERAQRAEGRALKAERLLARISERVGLQPSSSSPADQEPGS